MGKGNSKVKMQNSKLQFKIQNHSKSTTYNSSSLSRLRAEGLSPITFQKGFTLIELLVVMVILGILGSFTFANVFNGLPKARDAQRKSDLKQLQTALQLYYQDHNKFPELQYCSSMDSCWRQYFGETIPPNPYLKALIKDPLNQHPYYYLYCSQDSTHQKYVLVARLENANDPEIKTDGKCGTQGTNFYWLENP